MNARAWGLLVSVAAMTSFADRTITIPSTYDEGTGKWVGDVTALTNALSTTQSGDWIRLSKGVYDLTQIAADGAVLYERGGAGYGAAILKTGSSYVRLVGDTDDPKDVILTVRDSAYRILCMNSSYSFVRAITFEGGNAATDHISTYAYRDGGAIMMSGSNGVVTNCIFRGNNAATRGGAVSGPNGMNNGKVYDSVFYGNGDKGCAAGGIVADHVYLFGCTITNNVGGGTAASDWGSSVASGCVSTKCLFKDNVANCCGGVRGGVAVDCRFIGNRNYNPLGNQWGNAGGGAARDAVLSNCYFYGNSAYRNGGAIRGGTVVNCQVISNRTYYTGNDDSYGGGITSATLVEGCLVVSNYSKGYGGGLSGCTKSVNTTNMYNYARNGGGAYNGEHIGCVFANNLVDRYMGGEYNGAGAGLYGGSAVDCRFYGNSASATYGATLLKGCDIADSRVGAEVIDHCVLHEIDNGKRLAVGNVVKPDGVVISNMFMIYNAKTVRNCLVTNCAWRALGGTYANTAVFSPDQNAAHVENCTLADNNYYWLCRHYNATNSLGLPKTTLAFANCALVENVDANRDVSVLESNFFAMTNCIYGAKGAMTTPAEGYGLVDCTAIGWKVDPKFVGSGEHPYTPKTSSPLVKNKGVRLDWMDDALDLAGNPRLRDGKVDIGAYQCWLTAPGMMLLLR